MKVLAIGAHYDDIELGCGGTVAKHVDDGDQVFAYVATLSGFNDTAQAVIRSNEVAQEEGARALEILGVTLLPGRFKTLELEFAEPLNVEILRIVEKQQIDLVYTHWNGDIHHDHSILAQASFHSCRHVPRMLLYRSNWYHTPLEFRGNFYVDISAQWERKAAAISAHRSEMERTGNRWIDFFRNEALNAGQRIGVQYAEVFEVVKWLA